MLGRVGVAYLLRLDEVLSYEPVKVLYAETISDYPDLVDIAKDKKKRSLKPIVVFQSDLDALETEMIKTYGTDSMHKPVVWRQGVLSDDDDKPDEKLRGMCVCDRRWHAC